MHSHRMDCATGNMLIQDFVYQLIALDCIKPVKNATGRRNEIFAIAPFNFDITVGDFTD